VLDNVNQINFTRDAAEDLDLLRKVDQKRILDAIAAQLSHQADQPTRNRKVLQPNQLAEWELRVGDFRVFYALDLAQAIVKVIAIGQKRGSKLYVHGEEYEL
jgi:mRNA-degrading endonuclease RelE of RelBE toxin-antitoxin system